MGLSVFIRDDDVHIGGCQVTRPDQTLLVMIALSDCGKRTGYANTVRSHRHGLEFTVLIEYFQSQCLGVFTTKLEDMSHLNAACGNKRSGTIRCWVAFAYFTRFQNAVCAKVSPVNEICHVFAVLVSASNPRGTANHARINEKRNTGSSLTLFGILTQHGLIESKTRANIALDELREFL